MLTVNFWPQSEVYAYVHCSYFTMFKKFIKYILKRTQLSFLSNVAFGQSETRDAIDRSFMVAILCVITESRL